MASDVTSRAVRDGYKRTFDLCAVSLAGVVFAPLWLFLAVVIPLAIWLEDRGPVFFKQPRIGLGGEVFYMIKFRSMVPGEPPRANKAGMELEIALERLTLVGKLLRLFHLDELPQVFNILRGEMSLVGPRAEWVLRHEAICVGLPEFRQRLRVKPGIAGLAQARGNYWSSPREKLRYDNLYIESLGPWLDIKLIFLCIYAATKRAFTSRAQTGIGQNGSKPPYAARGIMGVMKPASDTRGQGHGAA